MTFFLLSAALLVVPRTTARRRLKALHATRRRLRPRPPNGAVVVALGALLGLVLGVGGAIAGVLLAVTVWRAHTQRRSEHKALASSQAVTEALAAFVAELRSGANPAQAARGAAEDAAPPAAEVFDTIATTAARGGDVEKALAHTEARHLARAWRLSGDHGVPLADVLEAVRDDLRQRARFVRHVQARMAGPRASAAVLAALPVVGVLLGELTGSNPVGVLSGTFAGQVLLVVGAVLVCAGLRWSAHLTRQVTS